MRRVRVVVVTAGVGRVGFLGGGSGVGVEAEAEDEFEFVFMGVEGLDIVGPWWLVGRD